MDTTRRETLGDYLKEERESRLISVAAVSKALKIDPSWVSSLEHNDFSIFPSKKEITDFLKRYAAFLLIDGEELVRRYEMQSQIIFPDRSIPESMTGPGSSKVPTNHMKIRRRLDTKGYRQRRFRLAVFAALAAIPLIVIGIYSIFYREPVKVLRDDLSRTERSIESRFHTPAPPPAPQPQSQLQPQKVIGNKDSKRYHLPGMLYYDAVEAYHRVEFNSEAEAMAAGYHKAPR
jgi:cytoskeletal protein RodZ